MSFERLATNLASMLVESALVASEDERAARAVILAQLHASPPDLKTPYEEARRALLGEEFASHDTEPPSDKRTLKHVLGDFDELDKSVPKDGE